jgi:hypothetical protein
MRCRRPPNGDFWFFTTTIGTNTYWNVLSDGDLEHFPDFGQEGAFERWNKQDRRLYGILLCALKADRLTVCMLGERFLDLMKAEQIPIVEEDPSRKLPGYFKTPPGWLAKYLAKNGPDNLFNALADAWLRPEVAEKERPAWQKEQRAREEASIKAAKEAERRREAELNEAYAENLVDYAKYLLDRGDTAGARRCLERVTRNCGETRAASKAKELLKKLNK